LLTIKSTTTENVKIQPPSPSPTPDDKDRFFPAGEGGTHIRVYGAKLNNQEYAEYKSVAVAPQDTCFALLPSILRKWKIKEDPKHYALYISINGQGTLLHYYAHNYANCMDNYNNLKIREMFIASRTPCPINSTISKR
jgi:hypothetical protein